MLPLPAVGQVPQQACRFWGNVRVDGTLVVKNTPIRASVPGVATTWTAYTGAQAGSGDADYLMEVPGDTPGGEKDGGVAGDTVSFEVFFGGVWCAAEQTDTWQAGGFLQLNLTATSVDFQPPPVPTLLLPLNGAGTNATAVFLDWSDVWDRSPPVRYDVQVDNNADFSSPEASASNLSSSNYTTPSLAVNTYWWRVRAKDGASPPNVSAWSTAWSFTIDLTPPPTPTLIFPASGTVTNNPRPAFDWSDVSDPSGVTYTIQADNNSDFSSPELNVSGIAASAYTPAANMANNLYYWRVRAVDGAGNNGGWSAVWTLTVFTALAPPTLLWPANATRINNNRPPLDWSDAFSPSTVSYRLQVSTVNTFATTVIDVSGLTSSTYTPASALTDGTYFWRVRAADGLGNDSGWTATWSFILDTVLPGKPNLELPANGAKTNNSTPLLDWSNVTDASGVTYSVQVSISNTFATTVVNVSGLTSSAYTVASALADGTYYWRVKTVDGAGNESDWTAIWSFLVDTVVGLPTLLVPANGAKINNNTPTLDWTDVTDPSGVTYRLQVSTTSTFTSLLVSQTSLTASQFTLTTALASGGTYYWRAKAVDGAGNDSGWTAAWSFYVDTTAPVAPALSSPSNGARTNNSTPTFSWSSVTDPSGVTYSIQVSTSNTFATTVVDVSGLASTTYTPSVPLADGTYYWRVRAVDGAGNNSAWSAVRNLIIDVTVPSVPTMLSPADGAKLNSTTPTLSWSSVAGAPGMTYSLQIAYDIAFTSFKVNATGLTTTTYTTAVLTQGTYYWRVRAVSGTGNASEWSTPWSFTVDTTAPGVPTLLSPASAARTNNTTPTLGWSAVTDPSGVTYSVQVSTSSAFTTTVVNVSGVAATEYTVSPALSAQLYYWRVRAVDGAGNSSSWPTARTFTIDLTAPAVPTLQTPANAAVTNNKTPSLTWSAVTDPSGVSYSVQVSTSNTFDTTVVNVSGLTSNAYTVPSALADGTYYWRVGAVDGAGNSSAWSAARYFTVDTAAPAIPLLLIPDNGTKTNNTTPDLDWADVSDFTGVTYSLQVSTVSTFSTTVVNVTGLTTSAYKTATLAAGIKYWRVKAIDGAGNDSGWSPTWNFTIDTTAPSVPTLISPANGATVDTTTPSLDWSDVTDPSAVSYSVQISASSTFATTVVSVGGLATSDYAVTTALAQGTWYWRVKAADGAGNESAWTAARNFIVDTPPPVPTLLSPADATRIRVSNPNLVWSAVTDPQGVTYSVQVSTTDTFATTVVNVAGLAATNHTTVALAQGIYYWRVRAVDGGGKASGWSGSWGFMVDLFPPVVTISLTGATFGGTVSSDFPIFLVQYRIDGGAWASASPSDGLFDGLNEGYFISSLPSLADGVHTIEVGVTDEFGDSATASKGFMTQQLFRNANQGWNLVTYQGPDKAITEALGSIMDRLIVVWAYDSETGKWRGYNPSVPNWANDLPGLVKGSAYWIRVNSGCTWIYEM